MALKSSRLIRPAGSAATISMMRDALADMQATTARTRTVIDATRDAIAAADHLLSQSISIAAQREPR
jgi:hypothetical protein